MKPEIKALHYTVPQKDIYYISWIIDAAEGIGFLQTDDARTGSITIFTTNTQLEYVLSLMDALRHEGLEICEAKEN